MNLVLSLRQRALDSNNPYEVLGVARTATVAQITRAYRRRCFYHHPDRGGTPQNFQAIQAAYALLSNPENRAFYDDTQQLPPGAAEIDKMALTRAQTVLAEILDQIFLTQDRGGRAFTLDPIALLKKHFREGLVEITKRIANIRAVLKQSRKLRRRIKYAKGRFNESPMGQFLYERQRNIRASLAAALIEQRVLHLAQEKYVADYTVEKDKPPVPPPSRKTSAEASSGFRQKGWFL